MTSSQLKLRLVKQIEHLNSASLKELYGLMLNYFNSKQNVDEWALMTKEEKLAVEEGLVDLEKRNRVSRKEAMGALRKRYR